MSLESSVSPTRRSTTGVARIGSIEATSTYTSVVAGYTHFYVIGKQGGFAGADGVNPIESVLVVGEADRMWFEARYFDTGHTALGSLKTMIPASPDALDMLLDACLCFHPGPFRSCPSFITVTEQLGDTTRLDFHHWTDIPAAWPELREEARAAFRQLHIWRADLEVVDLGS